MIKDELIDFVNALSNEDVVNVIDVLAPRLSVWQTNDGVMYLNDVEDASLNGTCVQLNLKHHYKSPEKTDELTRDQLYVTLTGKFHDDVWHCSKSEDGLVEIQFYVK